MAGSTTEPTLAPGTVDTDMVRNNTPEMQRAMAAASPMKRAAHPDEMVGPTLFLVSDAASFVTGQVVIGRLTKNPLFLRCGLVTPEDSNA